MKKLMISFFSGLLFITIVEANNGHPVCPGNSCHDHGDTTAINNIINNYSSEKDENSPILAEGDIRLADGQFASLYAFTGYDLVNRHGTWGGLRFVIKLGKSYEEERIEKLERMVEFLLLDKKK